MLTTSGAFSEFVLPSGHGVQALTAGGDGNIWFTDPSNLSIGKINSSGQIQEFPLPDPSTVNSQNGVNSLKGITEGPDGNVWFTGTTYGGGTFSSQGNVGIGKITPAGQITEFAVGGTTLGVFGSLQLITKAGNSLTFINSDSHSSGSTGNVLGRFTTNGTSTLYTFPSGVGDRSITGITHDATGNLWFLEVVTTGFINLKSQLEVGELNTAGQIFETPLISNFSGLTSGSGITVGGDGNLYIAVNDQIDQVALSVGSMTFNPLSNPNGGQFTLQSQDVTAGPDGNVWYTQQTSAAIVKLSVGGTTTPPPTPTATLRSISLVPGNPGVSVGGSQQFVATGVYSDNSSRDLTGLVSWASATPGVATVSASGLATGVAAGSSVISASLGGITAATTLTISPNIPPTPLPPSVTGITGVARSRKGVTTITVGFDEELNPTLSINPAFYHLALGVKKRKMFVFSQGIHIKAITYENASRSVTIRLSKPAMGKIQVIVRGGIPAANGAASSGNFTAVVP